QVQAEMKLSPWAAQRLVADAMSLIYRLPGVFAALKQGSVCEWRARMAASATRELTLEQVARADVALAAGHPDGDPRLARMSRKRIAEVIEQLCLTNHEDTPPAAGNSDSGRTAAEDEIAEALARRHVSMRSGERGVSELFGTLSSGDGQRLAQRLAQV